MQIVAASMAAAGSDGSGALRHCRAWEQSARKKLN
jgi:hypothetical protein